MDRELLLLGLLSREGMHGYQLNEYIDRQMAFCVDLKRSTVYYVLDKLCHEGYVIEEVEREGNRPERRTYRVTPSGSRRFLELLRANLAGYRSSRYSDDLGVIFQHYLPSAEIENHLQAKRAAIMTHREELTLLRTRMPDERHRAVVDHHLLHLDADLRWIDLLEQQTSHMKNEAIIEDNDHE